MKKIIKLVFPFILMKRGFFKTILIIFANTALNLNCNFVLRKGKGKIVWVANGVPFSDPKWSK